MTDIGQELIIQLDQLEELEDNDPDPYFIELSNHMKDVSLDEEIRSRATICLDWFDDENVPSLVKEQVSSVIENLKNFYDSLRDKIILICDTKSGCNEQPGTNSL